MRSLVNKVLADFNKKIEPQAVPELLERVGFYPVAGTDVYQLAAPLFQQAEIDLGNATLTVVADNYAPDHIYVKKVWLNGELLSRTWIKHKEIANGGTLKFEMSKIPKLN